MGSTAPEDISCAFSGVPKFPPAKAVPIIRERSCGGAQSARIAVYTGRKAAEPTPLRKRRKMKAKCAASRPRSSASGCCARLASVHNDINISITLFAPRRLARSAEGICKD